MPPVGVGVGTGSVVGDGVGATVVVGGAGGGAGGDVVRGGGADVRSGAGFVVVVRGGSGGAVVVGSGAGGGTYVVLRWIGAALLVVAGAGRFALDAGLALTAVRGVAFAVGEAFAVDVCAGAAPAIAAASPPVAITAPAATPCVTNDSRRSARSRWWWAGG